MTPYSLGIFFAVLTGVCWAVLAIGLKYALQFCSTGTIAWVRMIFAFSTLFLLYALNKPAVLKKVFLPPSKRVIVAGLFLAFNYFGYLKGLEFTSASNAQIMIQMGPLSLILFGVFYFKEPIRLLQWIGIAMALLGFAFFNWDQLLVTLDKGHIYTIGNIWLFFAAITWTAFAVLQKIQLGKGWTPQMINLLIYGVCCIALLPAATISELSNLTLWQWFILFLLGLNTLVAYGALAEAIHRIPASLTSLIISINPLLTIFIVLLLAEFNLSFISPEPIMWRGFVGAALVVSGVAIAVYLKPKNKSKKAEQLSSDYLPASQARQ